jgi:hypothetical protein
LGVVPRRQSCIAFLAAGLLWLCGVPPAHAMHAWPSDGVQNIPISTVKTRVGDFSFAASGRLPWRHELSPANTPGSRGCGYEMASGRAFWNERDPNYYSFCGGDPVNGFDPKGKCVQNTPPSLDFGIAPVMETSIQTILHFQDGTSSLPTSGAQIYDPSTVAGYSYNVVTQPTGQYQFYQSQYGLLGDSGAFSTIGSTGKVGEQYLQTLGGDSQVYFNTSQGARYVDQLVGDVANESKVGYQSLTPSISLQISKDAELLNGGSVQGVNWHFFQSPVTGLGGPSQPLLNALQQNGINVIIH